MVVMGLPRQRRRSAALWVGSSPLATVAAAAATTFAAGQSNRLPRGHSRLAAFVPAVVSPASGCLAVHAARVAGKYPSLAQYISPAGSQAVRIGAWATRAVLGVAAAAAAGTVALRAKGGEYESHTVAALKAMLKERGLPVSGSKAQLIERLNKASEGNSEKGGKAGSNAARSKNSKAKVVVREKEDEEEDDVEENEEEEEESEEPEAGYIDDPHQGKPDSIVDDEGRIRYLCLDGQYRRGDPDAVECTQENFHAWLSEWVVAARTGQLTGKPQKTFLPEEPDSPGNPPGNSSTAGKVIRSHEVLTKLKDGPDGAPRWEYTKK